MTASDSESVMLVRTEGEPWQEPHKVGYLGEADMQRMLAEQPSLIPGVGHEALAAREFHTGVGPSDVVVVDQDGSVTVVECKLASNVEIRRKIVGQVLDYAARMWRMPLTDFEARWRACSGGVGLVELLDEQAVVDLAAGLETGAFRLVLAVDAINDDLRNIVEYLNAHTNEQVTVLALELRRVSHGGVDILTPRTFGEELVRAKQDKAKREQRDAWSIEDVRGRLLDINPALRDTFDRLHEPLLEVGCTSQGGRAAQPSMIFRLETPDGRVAWPYAVHTYSTPVVQVNFHWLPKAKTEAREALLNTLSQVPISVDAAAIRQSGFQQRPTIPLATLDGTAVAQFAAAVAAYTGTDDPSVVG